MEDKIEVGDTVSVDFFASMPIHKATVLAAPAATGDSWILKESSGHIVYVQLFERMDKE